MNNLNTTVTNLQDRTGNGQYAGTKRVATVNELNARSIQRQEVAQDEEKQNWLAAHGLGDIEPDEFFA